MLIGEDKHRYFQKIVYYTDNNNMEKTMLLRKNPHQTMRFLLLDWCTYVEPEARRLINVIYDMYFAIHDLAASIRADGP